MAQIINNYEMMLIAHQSVTDEIINASLTPLFDVIISEPWINLGA